MKKLVSSDFWKNRSLYILVLLVIFVSDDTFLFGTSGIQPLLILKYLFFAILPLYFIRKGSTRISQYLLVFELFLLFSAFANISSFGLGVLMVFLLILGAYFFSKNINFEQFALAFSNIVFCICLYSLLIYVLAVLLRIIPIGVVVNIANSELDYALGVVFINWYGSLVRLASFFREPGVFMVYINLALLFDLFVNKREKPAIRILVYAVSILAAFSTGGLFTLSVIILAALIKVRKKSYIVTAVILVLIGAYALSNELIYAMFFNKIERGMDSASALGRSSSVFIPLGIWTDIIHNFLFGCGIKNFNQEYMAMGKIMYHTDIDPADLSTNTLSNAFALFGVGFGIMLITGLWKFSKRLGSSGLQKLMLFLAICFIYSNEHMLYSLPVYILVMYGFLRKSPQHIVKTE